MSDFSSSRIAVGVELWSDRARPLIRSAAAFAGQFATPWLAIAVSDSTHALSLLTPEERQRVRENTELVMSLGGASFFCEGDDVAQTLLTAAATNGVKLLILGSRANAVSFPASSVTRSQRRCCIVRPTCG